MNEKKVYEIPKVEIVMFKNDEIITSSGEMDFSEFDEEGE